MSFCNRPIVIRGKQVMLLFACACLLTGARPRKIPVYQLITAHRGPIRVVLEMRECNVPFTSGGSSSGWGYDDDQPTVNDFRCVGMYLRIRHKRLNIFKDVYTVFSNVNTVSVSKSHRGGAFAVRLMGGDASTSYWATVNFTYQKSVHQYEPVTRTIRSMEFPQQCYEKCTYHLW